MPYHLPETVSSIFKMSNRSPPRRSMASKNDESAVGPNSPVRPSTSDRLKGWLGNLAAGHQSRESLNPILPNQQYPRAMSVVSGIEGNRPGLHSRKTSRNQLARQRTSPDVAQQRSRSASPKVPIPPPNRGRFRYGAIVPFLLSATAFSFSLVLVLAGSKPGNMTDVNIMSVRLTIPIPAYLNGFC